MTKTYAYPVFSSKEGGEIIGRAINAEGAARVLHRHYAEINDAEWTAKAKDIELVTIREWRKGWAKMPEAQDREIRDAIRGTPAKLGDLSINRHRGSQGWIADIEGWAFVGK